MSRSRRQAGQRPASGRSATVIEFPRRDGGRLARLFSDHFDPGVRARGVRYRAEGRVRLEDYRTEVALATVRGTTTYLVHLDLSQLLDTGVAYALCTCPFFEQAPCKHLWGTILALDVTRRFDALCEQVDQAELVMIPAGRMAREVLELAGAGRGGEATRLYAGQDEEDLAGVTERDDFEDEDDDEDDFWDDDDSEDSDDEDDDDFDDDDVMAADVIGDWAERRFPGRQLHPWSRLGLAQPVRGRGREAVLPRDAETGDGDGPARIWSWEDVARVTRRGPLHRVGRVGTRSKEVELHYVVDPERLFDSSDVSIAVTKRERPADGEWGRFKRPEIATDIGSRLDDVDRFFLQLLAARPRATGYTRWLDQERHFVWTELSVEVFADVLEVLCRSGRVRLGRCDDDEAPILRWDDGPPWRVDFALGDEQELLRPRRTLGRTGRKRSSDLESFQARPLTASLVREASGEPGSVERRPLEEPMLLLQLGIVLFPDRAARLDTRSFEWIVPLRQGDLVMVPVEEIPEFLREWYSSASSADLQVPDAVGVRTVRSAPVPCLRVAPPGAARKLDARVSLDYDGAELRPPVLRHRVLSDDATALVFHDAEAEATAREQLREAGFRGPLLYKTPASAAVNIAPSKLSGAIEKLLEDGWRVEAEGKVYRSRGSLAVSVRSGTDWFELDGAVDFGGARAGLPELLAAVRKKQRTVVLDDGSMGLLPEEWLERWGVVAGAASPSKRTGKLRFGRSSVALIDALLAAEPQAERDAPFEKLRAELRRLEAPTPARAPKGFRGDLRPYQRDGLAWMRFLERVGFGGCLADDMGLGKTVQVLAYLLGRRSSRSGRRVAKAARTRRRAIPPSLIVVPRSLVFNWIEEARNFTPDLRVLAHVGVDRSKGAKAFDGADVVVTSYGTLRRDIAWLKEVTFDTVVLDEAQAIKNASTSTAKATRLLRAEQRLVLSGTPIENHLGELWSLFEFLNPGMLGSSKLLARLATTDATSPASLHQRELLQRALRPFFLRRTKSEVAADLPDRSEQTLLVDLEKGERRRYDELLAHYRGRVTKKVASVGVAKSTPVVLEALLRLRQAACHGGLLDDSRAGESSAKLQVLLDHLDELREGGHRALVFSQFTSLLALVRSRLDERGIRYEYLDGKTRDRKRRVERFQNDDSLTAFLLSIKAGGFGLNLTAADYVFILDPWWNPAVEAQAIDRTHRIGQTRHVFAYRLIARDTVEEKVAALQQTKRELAEAILGEHGALAGKLRREDLELLLG